MTGNLVMIGAFVLSVALMLVGIIAVKGWRRRDTRRSPLHGKKLANLPGQQLVTRMNDHGDELLLATIVMYFSFPIMLLAWAISRVQWETVQFRTMDWLFVIGAVAMFAYGLRRFVVHWDAKARSRDGLVAEQMTGQLLNRLIGPNCIVAHDLPCEGFNIDHIVIAPRAVYAVETKSFRRPRGSSDDTHYKVTFDGEALRFPDWRDDAPVIQARRQAQWLARYLRESLGREIPVMPAIALPGWWIDRTEESKRSDVRVFTPMGKGADFLLAGQDTGRAGDCIAVSGDRGLSHRWQSTVCCEGIKGTRVNLTGTGRLNYLRPFMLGKSDSNGDVLWSNPIHLTRFL